MLYAMVLSVMPFSGETEDQVITGIVKKKLKFKTEKAVSKEFKDLMNKILTKEPEQRISMFDLQNHPWMEMPDEELEKSISESQVEQEEEDKKKEDEDDASCLAKLTIDSKSPSVSKNNLDPKDRSLKKPKRSDLRASSPRLLKGANGGSFNKKKSKLGVKKKCKVATKK
jgi:serine/threonine protein kinase